MDVSLASLVNVAASYLASGIPPRRFGNDHMSIAPFGMLEASDGHLMLAVGNESQWRVFCNIIGRTDLSVDPRFRSNEYRVLNRIALAEELARTTRNQTVAQVVRTAHAGRCSRGTGTLSRRGTRRGTFPRWRLGPAGRSSSCRQN